MPRTNISRIVFVLVSAALVIPLLSGTLLGAPRAGESDDDGDSFYKYLSVFTEVLRLVRQVYVEEPDIHGLMAGALDGATDALDPFSAYVPARRVDEYLAAQQIGRRHSGLSILKERGVAYIAAVDEGSPADEIGLERGDIVAKIQGRPSRAMPLWQARQILALEEGSTVSLEVIRRGETLELDLELTRFAPPAVRLDEVGGLAVLRIPGIEKETADRVQELIAKLEGEPLLIDLRGVAGGDAEAAYDVAEHFTSGELGVLLGQEGTTKSFEAERTSAWGGPLGVLVDRGSQGAAEILAEVLRQSTGAKLLGEGTFGHAGQAGRVRLASGGLLEITEGFYTAPDGEPLDHSLEPDFELRTPFQTVGGKAEGDTVLDRAVETFLESLAPLEQAA